MTGHLPPSRYVFLTSSSVDVATAVRTALDRAGILGRVRSSTRVALKPNLTYPVYRPGVTTSPQVLRETVRLLRERTSHVAIVETDGGYGAWKASEAFSGHGVYDLARECGASVVNLSDEPREMITFRSGSHTHALPLPTRLLRETDLFLTIPVPKVHAMTVLSLSYKNQWGCIPDIMRLRRHAVFNDAVVAMNRALTPSVLVDGTFFLDQSGPMEGTPVPMNLIIAATDAGVCDRYLAELMGFSWKDVPHLRRAVELGDMPAELAASMCNVLPQTARTRRFHMRRTPRNWIALLGFHSRFMTWFGYESWFGRVVLHAVLYAIVGRPEKRTPPKS